MDLHECRLEALRLAIGAMGESTHPAAIIVAANAYVEFLSTGKVPDHTVTDYGMVCVKSSKNEPDA